jgi:hypothetical protein
METSMTRSLVVFAGAAAMVGALSVATPVHALTMKECSAKYQAARAGNHLDGMKWNEFRKAQCGTSAAVVASAAPATGTPPISAAAEPKAPPQSSNAVFPTAVANKYASESAGRARMHTCLDQYKANKADDANGGLTWIAKGGGYYGACNKRLKS